MDPELSDLIIAAMGGLGVLLTKGVKDWIEMRRQGKLANETHLVGSLTTALQKKEDDNDELRKHNAHLADLVDYWRGDSGHMRFLYRSETGKEPPPTSPPVETS